MSERSFAKVFFSRKNQNSVGRVASQGRKERKVFMKKVLLIVALLLVVSPVMAGVTITAYNEGTYSTPDGNRAAHVRIGYAGDVNVRAFALDVFVDSGCNFWNIRDFNVGENNATNLGYGIFPGRFRAFISATAPNWGDSNYSPLTQWQDPGTTNTGYGFGEIITEQGYLGSLDANMPAKSGTLYRIDVNAYAFNGTAHVTIAPDTMRGGVVSKDTNATITATYVPVDICFPAPCFTPTNEVGQTQAAALAVWGPSPGQGFTNIVGVGVVNCAQLGKVITNDQNCISLSTQLNYTYGINSTVPNVVSPAKLLGDANTAIIAAQLTVGTITYTCSATVAKNYVISSTPTAGTSYCGSVAMVVSTGTCDCFPSSDPAYSDWVAFGKPSCWCNLRQCHGDADGGYQGSTKTGLYYVGTNDLSVLLGAWQVMEPTKGPGIASITVNGIPGICADFAHDAQGSTKTGIYRVGTNDLSRLLTYWQVLEPTKGLGTPANCPHN
jgi:hypothetical protein